MVHRNGRNIRIATKEHGIEDAVGLLSAAVANAQSLAEKGHIEPVVVGTRMLGKALLQQTAGDEAGTINTLRLAVDAMVGSSLQDVGLAADALMNFSRLIKLETPPAMKYVYYPKVPEYQKAIDEYNEANTYEEQLESYPKLLAAYKDTYDQSRALADYNAYLVSLEEHYSAKIAAMKRCGGTAHDEQPHSMVHQTDVELQATIAKASPLCTKSSMDTDGSSLLTISIMHAKLNSDPSWIVDVLPRTPNASASSVSLAAKVRIFVMRLPCR
jgi:hypothetical protein